MRRLVLIVCTLLASWLGMQAVHEVGHVLGAWLTGGSVRQVHLPLLGFSRTDLASNPKPLFTVWAGPIFGCLAPMAAWGMACAARTDAAYLLRFFTGFCLIANGAYIGIGGLGLLGAPGDAGDLRRLGASAWSLALFGLLAAPLGLALWHGLGARFGLGKAALPVRTAHIIAAAMSLVALIALFIVF